MPILDPRTDFASEEEKRLYEQGLSLGNAEFEVDIAGFGGEFGQNQVSVDKVRTILHDQDKIDNLPPDVDEPLLQGTYVQQELREDYQEGRTQTFDAVVEDDSLSFELGGKDAGAEYAKAFGSEEPSIFTFGMGGNTKEVQSHEFRHMAVDAFKNLPKADAAGTSPKAKALRYIQKSMPSDMAEEQWNREFDVYRGRHNGFIVNELSWELDKKKYKGKTYLEGLPEAWKVVEAKMKKRVGKFSKLEAASQVYEGVNPPQGTTWKEHFLKQGEVRHVATVAKFQKMFEAHYNVTNAFNP